MFKHLSLLLAGWLAISARAESKQILSFDTQADMATLKANGSRVKQIADRTLAGGRALEVVFLHGDWPNVTVAPEKPMDWRGFGGLAMDIHNPGREPIQFGVRVDDDPRADGLRFCRQGGASLAPGKKTTFVMPLGANPMDYGMRGVPVEDSRMQGVGIDRPGPLHLEHIVAFQIFLSRPTAPRRLILDNIRLIPWTLSLEKIVDEFGQYALRDWPGKVRSIEDLKERVLKEMGALAASSVWKDRDRFGGWASGPQQDVTGYFRTEKVGGKWWLVTPEGRLFFSVGMDCVGTRNPTLVTGREAMFEWLPGPGTPLAQYYAPVSDIRSGPVREGAAYDFFAANLERIYGPGFEKPWYDLTIRRLIAWGFNTLGNWSDWKLHRNGRIPYVASGGIAGDHARVGVGPDAWTYMPDPFDPRFAGNAVRSLQGLAASVGDDPWCIGYFVDNELNWGDGSGDESRYALAFGALSADASASPAKRSFLAVLRRKYGDIGRFNAAWGTCLSTWAELEPPFRAPAVSSGDRREDLRAFALDMARRYFRAVRSAIRKVAPHHLYLGCRFAGHTPEAVQAASEYCDVVSFNIYAPAVDPRRYAFCDQLNKPCIIGEFHFGALDRGMFHTGLVGAASQEERAAMYRSYVRSVLDNPAFVGCHWFQYIDEPLTGRYFDGENYNIGFITTTNTPYPELVESAVKTHREAYRRRWGHGNP
ncbi:MAG: beta-galactosidase [Armatimonadetes bacterium]|nr:beta-galactosidase [Armatimonadota bacterium]